MQAVVIVEVNHSYLPGWCNGSIIRGLDCSPVVQVRFLLPEQVLILITYKDLFALISRTGIVLPKGNQYVKCGIN